MAILVSPAFYLQCILAKGCCQYTRRLSDNRPPRKGSPFTYFSEAGYPVLCLVGVFSDKASAISPLEELSPITWKRDK